MRRAFCLLAILGFTSCSTINYLGIETYNPAEITFPERVNKILIVNNAVPQPELSVCVYKLQGVLQDTCRAKSDSALIYASRSMGKAILEGDYFDDVLLYHEPLRTDNEFLVEQKLTPERVEELCRETNTDAIISLEKLLFVMQKDVYTAQDGLVNGDMQIQMGGTVRAYLPRRANPLASVQMADSVFWSESTYSLEGLNLILSAPNEALKIAGIYFGEKIYPYFTPYWKNESRWYYTGLGAQWKEAAAYTRAEKWEEAAQRWDLIYQKATKWEAKAKSASNAALACEMIGKLDGAYIWAEKALVLWKEHRAEGDADRQLTTLYMQSLSERIRLNKKLDQQIGAE